MTCIDEKDAIALIQDVVSPDAASLASMSDMTRQHRLRQVAILSVLKLGSIINIVRVNTFTKLKYQLLCLIS